MKTAAGKKGATQLFKSTFSNGLKILYLYTANDPISACHLFLPGGASLEAPERSGITTLMWSLLLKGTTRRASKQLAEDIEGIGASIGAGATQDYSEISCHAVSDYFPQALGILGEVLFDPAFVSSEVEKERTHLIAAIQSKKESIFTIAYEELIANLFKDHPYARPASGNETTVASFTAKDLLAWHRTVVSPRDAILAVASNVPFERMMAKLRDLFGAAAWPKRAKETKPAAAAVKPVATAIDIKRVEHFEQAYLLVGFPGAAMKSKDYMALKILNGCLGGGMSARLFQRLREEQGLAYDVGCFFPSKQNGSAFVVHLGLQASKIEQAKRGIEKELNEIRSKKIPAKELGEVKNYLKGTYILDHQTNGQRAHYLGWWQTLGMTAEFDSAYIKKLSSVTAAQVQAVARRYLGHPPVTVEILPKSSQPAPGAESPLSPAVSEAMVVRKTPSNGKKA